MEKEFSEFNWSDFYCDSNRQLIYNLMCDASTASVEEFLDIFWPIAISDGDSTYFDGFDPSLVPKDKALEFLCYWGAICVEREPTSGRYLQSKCGEQSQSINRNTVVNTRIVLTLLTLHDSREFFLSEIEQKGAIRWMQKCKIHFWFSSPAQKVIGMIYRLWVYAYSLAYWPPQAFLPRELQFLPRLPNASFIEVGVNFNQYYLDLMQERERELDRFASYRYGSVVNGWCLNNKNNIFAEPECSTLSETVSALTNRKIVSPDKFLRCAVKQGDVGVYIRFTNLDVIRQYWVGFHHEVECFFFGDRGFSSHYDGLLEFNAGKPNYLRRYCSEIEDVFFERLTRKLAIRLLTEKKLAVYSSGKNIESVHFEPTNLEARLQISRHLKALVPDENYRKTGKCIPREDITLNDVYFMDHEVEACFEDAIFINKFLTPDGVAIENMKTVHAGHKVRTKNATKANKEALAERKEKYMNIAKDIAKKKPKHYSASALAAKVQKKYKNGIGSGEKLMSERTIRGYIKDSLDIKTLLKSQPQKKKLEEVS